MIAPHWRLSANAARIIAQAARGKKLIVHQENVGRDRTQSLEYQLIWAFRNIKTLRKSVFETPEHHVNLEAGTYLLLDATTSVAAVILTDRTRQFEQSLKRANGTKS